MINVVKKENLLSCCSGVVQFEPNDFKNKRRNIGFGVNLTEQVYNTVCSSIIWEGLPDDIPEDRIEPQLNFYGMCAAFEREGIPMILPVTAVERMNQYGVPTMITCTGFGSPYGMSFDQFTETHIEDFVLIRNNSNASPSVAMIYQYIDNILQTDKTISQNLLQQMLGGIIKFPQGKRLSVENMIRDSLNGLPWLMVDENFDSIAQSWVDTQIEFKGDKLYDFRQKYLSELFSMFGIMIDAPEKAERMATEEVLQHENKITAYRNMRMLPRKQACDKINKKFGWNVSVRFFDDYETIESEGGAIQSGILHSTDQKSI